MVKIAKSNKYDRTKKKVFLECKGQNVFRTVEKIKPFGHSRAKNIAKGTTDPRVEFIS